MGGQPMNKKEVSHISAYRFLTLIMACFNFINMANAICLQVKEGGHPQNIRRRQWSVDVRFFIWNRTVGRRIYPHWSIDFFLLPVICIMYLHCLKIQLFTGFGLVYFLLGLWIAVTLLAGLYPATINLLRSSRWKSSGLILIKGLDRALYYIKYWWYCNL